MFTMKDKPFEAGKGQVENMLKKENKKNKKQKKPYFLYNSQYRALN